MLRARIHGEEGVALVEATIAVMIILLLALMFMQIVIVFHASLAAHAAAQRAARDGALTGSPSAGQATATKLQGSTIRIVKWSAPSCWKDGNVMRCQQQVHVPSIMPGGGLFMGGSWSGVDIIEDGQYPMYDKTG
ncbi:MAG: TadE/TadG family type IV pilus assembly protein [Bacillota bacterium]